MSNCSECGRDKRNLLKRFTDFFTPSCYEDVLLKRIDGTEEIFLSARISHVSEFGPMVVEEQ